MSRFAAYSRSSKGAACLLVLSCLLALSEGSGGADSFVLQVTDMQDGRLYYALPVPPEIQFSIEFLHSYDRLPCWDQYQVRRDGTLVYRRTGGRSLLNGQGFFYEGFRILPGGTWEIDGINETLESILFYMGSKGDADHHLILPDRTILLSERIDAGRIVRVSIQKKATK
jgi:hypothetical protein